MERRIKKIEKEIKGITLVALVITIIVLLILSGVAISFTIGDNGIFRKAQDATKIYENAQKNEKIEIDKVSNYINNYLNEDKEEPNITSVIEAIEKGTVFKENMIIYDEYNNPVKVPAGFKLATDSGTDVTKGIVIEDVGTKNKGNQYVWIPIGKIYINEDGEYKEIKLGRYDFENNSSGELKQSADNFEDIIPINVGQDHSYQELVSGGKNVITKNLEDFISKAKTCGGYYIGRYEVGDENATEMRNFEDNLSHADSTPVVKKEKWPYTFVNQSDAAMLARNLGNDYVESDLMNSYAWDTAIIFIQTFSGDIDYSKQNRIQTTIATTGNAHDGNNNYDVRCNIYDMAGNVREWFTETCTDDTFPCTLRGGQYADIYNNVSYRDATDNHPESNLSFRPILYL